MSQAIDLERTVTDWLRSDASSPGSDRVLSSALARAAAVPQDRPGLSRLAPSGERWWLRWARPRQLAVTLGVAAVLVTLIVTVLPSLSKRDLGETTASPHVSTVPSPTEAPRSFPSVAPGDAGLSVGRHHAVVDGVAFTFVMPKPGWVPQRGFYLVKSITGPDGADGTIRWTTIPNGEYTQACPDVLDDAPGQSVDQVVTAVAGAPGVRLVEAPTDVTIGGRPGAHVVVRVERDLGCDPGYFYAYDKTHDPPKGGPGWGTTGPGVVISVWVVEAEGKLLFIEGEATDSVARYVADTFQRIVDSMRFE